MNRSELLEALMHMECINDAWNELWFAETLGLPNPDGERALLLREEISTRIWAAIYLVQANTTGAKPDNYQSSLDEARRFNGSDFGESEPRQPSH